MDHIGMDVHKKESQLCITEAGELIERRVRSEPERFAAVLGDQPQHKAHSRTPRGQPEGSRGLESCPEGVTICSFCLFLIVGRSPSYAPVEPESRGRLQRPASNRPTIQPPGMVSLQAVGRVGARLPKPTFAREWGEQQL